MKENLLCLERRLKAWRKGDIRSVLEEGRALQRCIPKSHHYENQHQGNLARAFAKLMFQGNIRAATELLSQQGKGGVLGVNDVVDKHSGKTVLDVLRSKHPPAQPINIEALVEVNNVPPEVHPVIYDQITASSSRSAALRTQGSAGPSGLHAHSWR